MEFTLSDEQRALQDAVRSYLRGKFDLAAVRQVYDDPAASGNPAELWKALGEQGWLAVLVPEEYDGLGLGLLDAAVIVRCLGAGAVPGRTPRRCWRPRRSGWPAATSSSRPGCPGSPPGRCA